MSALTALQLPAASYTLIGVPRPHIFCCVVSFSCCAALAGPYWCRFRSSADTSYSPTADALHASRTTARQRQTAVEQRIREEARKLKNQGSEVSNGKDGEEEMTEGGVRCGRALLPAACFHEVMSLACVICTVLYQTRWH